MWFLWLLCWGGILLYVARDYPTFGLLLEVLRDRAFLKSQIAFAVKLKLGGNLVRPEF
jgi:hypothetical protein